VKPRFLEWLIDKGNKLKTKDSIAIQQFEFAHSDDEKILSEWAKLFRNYYCDDTEIDSLKSGTEFKSKKAYLKNIVFPDESLAPGPSIRSGDFAEIFLAEYLRWCGAYWVPAWRYDSKSIRNESEKGSDIIAFKLKSAVEPFDANDVLLIFEVKAKLTGKFEGNKLQEAIEHSNKDEHRKAESLNALKRRYIRSKALEDAKKVERFQNSLDKPYIQKSGAAAIVSNDVVESLAVAEISGSGHFNKKNLLLIRIKGQDLMKFAHQLYEKAANEA
jgi:hypothetical protein